MELQGRVEELRAQGLGVVAISYDSEEVLADFSQRRGITFPLLSDDDSSVITAFGILNTVAAEGVGPNREDPDVVADVAKYVSLFGATQNIGSGILPIIGGVLASFAWFYPFAVPVVGLPIGLYLVYVLDNDTPDKTSGTKGFLGHAWRHLNDRRVIELIAMTGCFIFIGFGLYVTYLPLFMKDNLAASSFLIGVVLSSRSISGAIMAAQLGRLTTIFSYRTLIVFSFAILGVGLALVPFAESFWVLIVATTCYGAGFGIARPSLQVILLDIAPDNLRATFASASGLSLRMAQFIAPILAGSVLIFRDYTDLYIGGAGLAFGFAALAYFAKSLRPEKN